MINKFNISGQNPFLMLGYNWELQDGSLTGATGQTSTVFNKSNFTVSSTFDSQAFKDATELSWARTILHEGVHAYFVAYYNTNRPGFVGTYAQMVQDWGLYQNWNDVHHEEFARSLVRDIAKALEEFGNLRGYHHSFQYYESLAWAGLDTTTAFQSLPSSDKQSILDTISVELTGKDLNGNSKTQKRKKCGLLKIQ